MKITSVSTVIVSVPMPKPWTMGLGTFSKKDELFVLIDTDEGIQGLGTSYPAFAPAFIEAGINAEIAPKLIGRDPLDVQGIWDSIFGTMFSQGAATVLAMSGIDIALWDILGKHAGLPVHQLLGAGGNPALPAYVGCMTMGHQEPDSLAAEAMEYAKQGYKAIKVRGGAGVKADVVAVAAVRDALPDVDIMVDANSAYSWGDALRLCRRLEEYELTWLEDPFDYTVAFHHNQMGKLANLSPVPICTGANLFTRFEFQSLLEAGGCQYVTPDVAKCGGISEAMRIAAMASAQGILVAPHTLAGLSSVANLHFTAAIPSNARSYLEWDPTLGDVLQTEMISPPVRVEGGLVYAPEGPGLGVTLNKDAAERYERIPGGEITAGTGARGESTRLMKRYQ